jgi:Domain of unknown function DUF11
MRTAHLAVVLPVVGLLAFASAAMATSQAEEADLAATTHFVGHGRAKAKVGQLVTLAVTVKNNGPFTARGVTLFGGGSDHFDVISTTCGGLRPTTNSEGPCGDLGSGQSVSGTVVLKACCFPVGETRDASGVARVSSSTSDPNGDNNRASTDIRIIGRHG